MKAVRGRGEKGCRSERGRNGEELSAQQEGNTPAVSRVIMKCQLWYVTVPRVALLSGPLSQRLSFFASSIHLLSFEHMTHAIIYGKK